MDDAISEVKYARSGLVLVASQLNSPAYFCKTLSVAGSGGSSSEEGKGMLTVARGLAVLSSP